MQLQASEPVTRGIITQIAQFTRLLMIQTISYIHGLTSYNHLLPLLCIMVRVTMISMLIFIQQLPALNIENVTAKLIPIVSKWKEVGEAFGFDEDHLDEIFTNNETDEDCLQAMLEFYFKNSDYEHSWEEIDKAVWSASTEGMHACINLDF